MLPTVTQYQASSAAPGDREVRTAMFYLMLENTETLHPYVHVWTCTMITLVSLISTNASVVVCESNIVYIVHVQVTTPDVFVYLKTVCTTLIHEQSRTTSIKQA